MFAGHRTTEVDMALSRKRQRELKRLKRSAEELWDEQREAHRARERRAARTPAARPRTTPAKRSGPRVRDTYDRPRPARRRRGGIAAGRSAASQRRASASSDDVLPAISGAIGSALAMLEVAKDPRVRDVVQARELDAPVRASAARCTSSSRRRSRRARAATS